MKWLHRHRAATAAGLICGLVLACSPLAAAVPQSSSPNYQVDETFFGAGGELHACSATYCSKQAAGEIAAGNTAATAFQAQAGFNSNRAPYLAFSVSGGPTDLGTLSSAGTAFTSGTFAVKTYLSNGYIVQAVSNPPTNIGGSNHQLTPLGSPTSPSPGTEQFGINLVANTSPSVGQNPVQVPDNTFSFGTVASGYDQVNKFKYVKGDTIAQSTRSTGETDFTVSFIYNISPVTPDGTYNYDGVFVATSTY